MSAVLEATPKVDNLSLLRLATAGSVDDGKSTLIGRLLVDTKGAFEDQIKAAQSFTENRGGNGLDLAFLTDGLKAEREQGITIDVAYRYFATSRRRFIIADTPGHEQYTRNMVTGASTADLGLILVDARNGVVTQSRRHAYIAHLLGIEQFVVAINKMDLVGYAEAAYNSIKDEFNELIAGLDVRRVTFVPISAVSGDMVVERGENMPWYEGDTLLQVLEAADSRRPSTAVSEFRLPVQGVCRPQGNENRDFRGYTGRIAAGTIRVGDRICVLPSGLSTTVTSIVTYDGLLEEVSGPRSITLTLADEIDISRGDLLAGVGNSPRVEHNFEATLCWMHEEPLELGRKYLLKHTTRTTKAVVRSLDNLVDITTLKKTTVGGPLDKNGIGNVQIEALLPIVYDPYGENRETGAFILIDPQTNSTLAAGMISG